MHPIVVALVTAAAFTVPLSASAAPLVPPSSVLVEVRPVSPQALRGGPLTSVDGRRAQTVLTAANRYAMRTWWPTIAPSLLNRVAREPRATSPDTDNIRRLGMQAFSLAVSLQTGAYEGHTAGASASAARAAAGRILDVLTANHVANRGDGWGGEGQSSLWSSFVGRAGWLLYDWLPTKTRQTWQRMLVYEADLATEVDPLYLRDRLGRNVRPGNTAAEEDAWQALPLQLATTVLPTHPHLEAWRHAEIRLMLTAWMHPLEVDSPEIVNGAPLLSWVEGSNTEYDGGVVNHNRIAPDYTTNLFQNLDAVLVDSLAGVATPEAARHGLAEAYSALTSIRYTGHAFASPGGTVYQNGRIYYPQGCDWGTGQYLPYALVDAQAAAFGFGTARTAADETAHLQQHQMMLRRFTDGRTYANDHEYRYVGREEHTAQLAAQLYLTKLIRDRRLAQFTDQNFFAPAARSLAGLGTRATTPFNE